MKDRESESLGELLRRFMDAPAATAAEEDIREGERLLHAWPAPVPGDRALDEVKLRMIATARRRHRSLRLLRGSLATAAAVVVVALIGLLGRGPADPSGATFASIIPTAVWESDDIEADDLDLAYFTSEIQRIEARMQALEEGETDVGVDNAAREIEMELMQIVETEFWKG